MTKLDKMPDDEKVVLCRKYFYIGFALLPFMWAVNFFWFFRQAFLRKPVYPQQGKIRQLVIMSGIGALVWFVGLVTWIVIFQTHRVAWGALGDELSLVFPRGYA